MHPPTQPILQPGPAAMPQTQAAGVSMPTQPGFPHRARAPRQQRWQQQQQPKSTTESQSAVRHLGSLPRIPVSETGPHGQGGSHAQRSGMHLLQPMCIQSKQQQVQPQTFSLSQMRHALVASWDLSDPLLQSTSISSSESTHPFSEVSAAVRDQAPAHAANASSSSLSSVPANQPLRSSIVPGDRLAAAVQSASLSCLTSEDSGGHVILECTESAPQHVRAGLHRSSLAPARLQQRNEQHASGLLHKQTDKPRQSSDAHCPLVNTGLNIMTEQQAIAAEKMQDRSVGGDRQGRAAMQMLAVAAPLPKADQGRRRSEGQARGLAKIWARLASRPHSGHPAPPQPAVMGCETGGQRNDSQFTQAPSWHDRSQHSASHQQPAVQLAQSLLHETGALTSPSSSDADASALVVARAEPSSAPAIAVAPAHCPELQIVPVLNRRYSLSALGPGSTTSSSDMSDCNELKSIAEQQ